MKAIELPERFLRVGKPTIPKSRKTQPENYLYWVQEEQRKQWREPK